MGEVRKLDWKVDDIDLFTSISIFKNISYEEKAELSILFRWRGAKRGEVIFRKGDTGSDLYFIKEGAIKISVSSNIGEKRIISILSKGDFFGELAVLDNLPRSTEAIALEPTRLLLLGRSQFLEFLKKNDAAMENFLSFLIKKIRHRYRILADSSFLNIPAQLKNIIGIN